MQIDKPINVSVVGLGRVGLITLFHLAGKGFKVYACDTNKNWIQSLKNKSASIGSYEHIRGTLPDGHIIDPSFDSLLKKHYKKISFHSDLPDSSHYFICVPTPFNEKHRKMDLSCIRSVLNKIKASSQKKHIFIRSTLSPGDGKTLSNKYKHINLYYFPEFFREGCFFEDYKIRPYSILGCPDKRKAHHFSAFQFSKTTEFCSLEEAEILKMACNLFHGIKVSFANEMGRIACQFSASPNRIMNLFMKDRHLNISEKYLKPGFSYGGPCLSKDIRSLQAVQNRRPLLGKLPLSTEDSNALHIQWAARQIKKWKARTIGVLGCSFTGNPAYDCRNSPVLKLMETLSKSKNIKLYGFEAVLTKHKCAVLPEKSFCAQLPEWDMCLIGGWIPHSQKYFSRLLNYKGIIFDLLIQNLPAKIKKHPHYKNLYS